ncbi:hypothetical protein [Variovorax boronicumulans]|uniref:hypothetical protein n=1 Tax=Variovorax boronicumulans TaxID=436515 RepID=UPI0027D83B62|nr:hypothetical protein [Variovorax boronicumulans]
MSSQEPRPASTWSRFWSPKSLLEQVPPTASSAEAEAIEQRNNVWLKTYMDMYILRWGGLWAASLAIVLLVADASAFLFAIALVPNLAALGGLVAMILTYRRASGIVQDRTRKKDTR